MNASFRHDLLQFSELLQQTADYAGDFLSHLHEEKVSKAMPSFPAAALPEKGMGAAAALEAFDNRFGDHLVANAGPRYFGFVTGGVTPAALAGDWLAATIDMNPADRSAVSYHIETETIALLRQLFGLPEDYLGCFVSGATMSNFTGLATARQWLGAQQGVDVAADGAAALKAVHILSATPHSSVYKALSMLGLGRNALTLLPTLPDREAADLQALKAWIAGHPDQPFIYIASAGTVNTVDFDDLQELAALKKEHTFWLHIDAAFGGFAAVSPRYRHLLNGWEAADSITIDAHKWLNVPYDAAMIYTRHPQLQLAVFQNPGAAYLGDPAANFNYIHYAPENSRRLRSLPAWFSLQAYGAEGYRDMVESNIRLARQLGERLVQSGHFRLLAPVRMCVVCFSLNQPADRLQEHIHLFLQQLVKRGLVYLTPTVYKGTPAIRAALVNWRTTDQDIDKVVHELETIATAISDLSAIIGNN
ncbi:pyridoxal-dependent decarboxylase [Chitinophaga sp. XS-30]|uniref:pyridoxal phosphate-dependent decarboxylase family protein n=1 Tax=Chitinophaga sp. XS-30 TaxID=2604421 RepID=UPI0011DE0D79|nr:pyridoxal-dependent decarboxylase [Chitinophaga sp. XS-30]QEH41902.1 aspartate aminotransferase family protein [Chitinophaga sp. XS-30]